MTTPAAVAMRRLLSQTSSLRLSSMPSCAICLSGLSRSRHESLEHIRGLQTTMKTAEGSIGGNTAANTDASASTSALPARPTEAENTPKSARPKTRLQNQVAEQLAFSTPNTSEQWTPSFSMSEPPRHPVKHRKAVCMLTLSAYSTHLSNLTFYTSFALHAAHAFGIPATLAAPLPVQSSLRTVPRSPFVHKPSQENFIKKKHSRYFRLFDAPPEQVDAWLSYLHQNGMDGVQMKANLLERKKVGFGADMVEQAESQVGGVATSLADKVKEMANTLLQTEMNGQQEQASSARSGASDSPSRTGEAENDAAEVSKV